MRVLPRAWPGLLLFAAALAVLDFAAHGRVSGLAVRAIAAGLSAACVFSIIPWKALFRRLHPGTGLYRAGLFLVFLWHFSRILEQEAWRLYAARRMAVSREFGPRGFASLAHATASLFTRTLIRAERFHAGLAVREFEP